MSYRRNGLGAKDLSRIPGAPSPGATTSAPSPTATPRLTPTPAPAPLANLTRPFNLVPPECERVGHDYTPPPATIPAGKPLVTSFVRVRFSGSVIQALLDQLSPKGIETTRSATGSAPPAARGISSQITSQFPLRGLGSGSDGVQVPTNVINWLAAWPQIGDPTYVGAGWIPDSESSPSWTRGVLWVAVAVDRPIVMATLRRAVVDLVERARVASGSKVTIDVVGTTPAAAASTSDDAVLEAAYMSATGIMQFGAFITSTFSAGTVSGGIHRIADPINRAAQRVREGFEVFQNLAMIESAVDTQITTALSTQPPTTGLQILQNARGGVVAARGKVEGALRDAPGILQAASIADTQLKQQLQQTILSSVDERLKQQVPYALGRELVRCATLKRAQMSFTHVETQLSQSLSTSVPVAQQVVAQQEEIRESFPRFETMLTKIARAEADLPLPWFSRHWLGLPIWAWGAGGAVAVVGGAVTVRMLRKKKVATPNRRRVGA